MNKKTLLFILLLAILVVACSPARQSAIMPVEEGFVERDFAVEAPAAEPRAVPVDALVEIETVESGERIVIVNASMEIVVDAPDQSLENISSMAAQMGGFVVNANLFNTRLSDGQEVPRASITIRVPAERLEEAIAIIEAESDRLPINKSIQSQDITSEYTDLQSRLKNLEAAEAQLMEIMASANKTEDVLNVFDQLTRVREQIEVIKGQIKYFDESARLSAISVELIPNEVVQPISIGGWQPVGVIKNAIEALIRTLQGLVDVLIWLGLFVLPILVVIFVPLYFIVRAVVRRRRRRKENPQKQANETFEEGNQEGE
jgi:hypothetical protein